MRLLIALVSVAAVATACAKLGSEAGSSPEGWVCKIVAKGNTYTGSGSSRAIAEAKAFEACKATRRGDYFCKGFDCKSPLK